MWSSQLLIYTNKCMQIDSDFTTIINEALNFAQRGTVGPIYVYIVAAADRMLQGILSKKNTRKKELKKRRML